MRERHPRAGRPRRRRGVRGVPRGVPAQAGAGAGRRPRDAAVLRPARPRGRRRRSASTSDGGTCTTTPATRWSSTGGPTCRPRSTGPPGPSRWASCCAGGSASSAARSRRTRTSTCSTAPRPRRRSAILAGEIERPRVGPMRDIVATIQPEQDVIVRADVAETLCVQGAPGTGKTAVGLHRAAYLLYAHRDRLRRGGVLVVGPNRAFLSYISAVLPALGEVDVRQVTLEELVGARVEVRAVEPAAVAALKGDARMAQVLGRAVHAGLARADRAAGAAARVAPLAGPGPRAARDRGRAARPRRPVRRGPGDARAAAGARAADQDGGGRRVPGRPGAGRGGAQRPGAQGGRRAVAGGRPGAGRDGAAVRRRRCWPAPPTACSTPDEQALLLWAKPPRGREAAPWTLADAVLVDEVADLVDREPSLGHVVLDEAQDLSPMQLRAVGRRCSTGVGDRARRHRAGHHPVGHHRLGADAAAPRQAGRARRGAARAATGCPPRSSSSPRRLLPHIAPGVSRARVGARERRPARHRRRRSTW